MHNTLPSSCGDLEAETESVKTWNVINLRFNSILRTQGRLSPLPQGNNNLDMLCVEQSMVYACLSTMWIRTSYEVGWKQMRRSSSGKSMSLCARHSPGSQNRAFGDPMTGYQA